MLIFNKLETFNKFLFYSVTNPANWFPKSWIQFKFWNRMPQNFFVLLEKYFTNIWKEDVRDEWKQKCDKNFLKCQTIKFYLFPLLIQFCNWMTFWKRYNFITNKIKIFWGSVIHWTIYWNIINFSASWNKWELALQKTIFVYIFRINVTESICKQSHPNFGCPRALNYPLLWAWRASGISKES